MQTRELGSSGLQLTTVGLGAWAMGGPWQFGWGPQDDDASVATIHCALDLGINWIDTAAVYGLGHAEEVVGKALADRKGKVLIASKCGLRWHPDGTVYGNLSAQSIRQEVEASLRRLQVETIDLYQIHWPNPSRQIEEGWATVAELITQGKIRFAGVSNFSAAQMERAQQIHPITSLQPPYSMLRREVEQEILPFCARHGIGVVAYSPMQAGLLTGAFSAARLKALPEDDWRRKDRFFLEPGFSATLDLVERLRPLAEQSSHTLAQLAIAWVLRRPELTAAIVGARTPEQIRETAKASDWQLTNDEEQAIEEMLEAMPNQHSRQ